MILKFSISEHLGLALALNVPVFVVITKIDMCPPNVLQETMKLLSRVLKSPGCRKIPMIIQNKDDVVVSASNFVSERWEFKENWYTSLDTTSISLDTDLCNTSIVKAAYEIYFVVCL